jgi:hypothetical protein
VTRYWLDPAAVSFREVGGEVVVLDVRSSSYITVNEAGAVLWRLLAAGATLDDLTGALVGNFGLDADAARRDAQAFLESLTSRRFVVTVRPSH